MFSINNWNKYRLWTSSQLKHAKCNVVRKLIERRRHENLFKPGSATDQRIRISRPDVLWTGFRHWSADPYLPAQCSLNRVPPLIRGSVSPSPMFFKTGSAIDPRIRISRPIPTTPVGIARMSRILRVSIKLLWCILLQLGKNVSAIKYGDIKC